MNSNYNAEHLIEVSQGQSGPPKISKIDCFTITFRMTIGEENSAISPRAKRLQAKRLQAKRLQAKRLQAKRLQPHLKKENDLNST